MTLFLALAWGGLCALAFFRMPAGLVALLVGGGSVALGLWQLVLAGGEPGRALASLVVSGLALGSVLVAPASRRPRRSVRKPKRPTRAPSTAGAARATRPGRRRPGEEGGLARYELQERVGVGGMASVYRAVRREDGKTVALKIPQEKFVADAKFVRRFHREAEVLARLSHPNIVRVYEHANEGATHYIAMEFVEGEPLENLIEERRLGLRGAVFVMRLTAEALRHIHGQGIVHRDIKPGNIMVVKNVIADLEGERPDEAGVKLMDFGIAAGKVLTRLTMTGARVGTPVYMSPEQARGARIDHRSDIYSLGLVFYEAITATTPFKGGYEAVVHQQIFQTPPPPRQVNHAVPQAMSDLVMRMIEKEPDRRPSLAEVIEAIRGGLFEPETRLTAPSGLLLAVNARQGAIRLLDRAGQLERSLRGVGSGEDRFAVAPAAVAADPALNLYAAVLEHRSGGAALVHKLSPEGAELLAFGPYGMRPGELLYPVSLAVGAGGVYVLDGESQLVSRYSFDGAYLGRFGGRGGNRGAFDDPRAVVAGPDGTVCVLDWGNRRVQRFSAEGEFLNKYSFRLRPDGEELRRLDGLAVDPSGRLLIFDASASKIRTLLPDGKQGQAYKLEPLGGEDTTSILDIGVDHEGFVYAGRRGGHLVRKFSPDGRLVATLETYAPLLAMNVYLREPARGVLASNPA